MGRISLDEVDRYSGSGGGGFFSLKDDGDTAIVRILYDGIKDVEPYVCHKVKIDGRDRNVSCLTTDNKRCPFCEGGIPRSVKVFVPIVDLDDEREDRVLIWERGKTFLGELSSLCAEYAEDMALYQNVFKIRRIGRKGETSTKYQILPYLGTKKNPVDNDVAREELPDLPNIVGGVVLEKSAEDMEYYLSEKQFPPEEEGVVRRKSRARDEDEDDEDLPFGKEDDEDEEEERPRRRSERRVPTY